MGRRSAILVVVVAALALAGPANAGGGADALARARAAIDSLDYPVAGSALDDALAAGTSKPDELAEIYQLRGMVAGALDERAAAVDAFARMLALRPTFTFPPHTSPKYTEPFDAARARLAGARLAVKAEPHAEPPSVSVVIESDPLGMVARARVAIVADGTSVAPREAQGRGRIEIGLPPGHRLELGVVVLDDHGNALVELAPLVITAAVAVAAAPAAVAVAAPASSPALYRRWWIYGGAAFAFAVVGTAYELAAHSASDDLQHILDDSQHHPVADAQAAESRARHDLVLADVTFAVAGGFAVASAVIYLTRPQTTEHAHLVARPTHGGAALSLEGRF